MKFLDFLKVVDFSGLYIIIYIGDEEDPIWEGNQGDIPYWLCDLELIPSTWGNENVSYCSSLGEKYGKKPGVIIYLNECEE